MVEYNGKEVQLNKPIQGDIRMYKVYVKNSQGNVIKVNFGDPSVEIKRDSLEVRNSFLAMHKYSDVKNRTYWACKNVVKNFKQRVIC